MVCPCSTYELLEQMLQDFCLGRIKQRDHFVPSTDKKILLKCILK
jgi:hypothetical protein